VPAEVADAQHARTKASKQVSRSQSFTKCTQSFAEKEKCAPPFRTIRQGCCTTALCSGKTYSVKLCVHFVKLCDRLLTCFYLDSPIVDGHLLVGLLEPLVEALPLHRSITWDFVIVKHLELTQVIVGDRQVAAS
jgi:hypothetical protein